MRRKFLLPLLFFIIIIPLVFSDTVEITIEYENVTTTTTTTTTIPQPTQGGPTGPSIPSIPSSPSNLSIITGPIVSITENERLTIVLVLNNTGETDLHNINIKVYGLLRTWYEINPEYISVLPKGKYVDISVTITPTSAGNYTFSINATSDELNQSTVRTLVVKEMSPQAKLQMQLMKKQEEARKVLEPISYLLIVFGFIGPAAIAAVFLHRRLRRKCMFCGGPLKLIRKGENFDTYQCTKCGRYEFIPKKRTEKPKLQET